MPSFREAEVDSYFTAFEFVATALQWLKEMWALLLQCKLVGKAQEVCSTLPIDKSLDYNMIKATVLRAYELVPEAYRQRFRALKKTDRQTFVEFVKEKQTLFDKWCVANKVNSFEDLRELKLLEDFKGCTHENLVVHLNEQKVTSLSAVAVLTDEFVLTHRTVFSLVGRFDRVAVHGTEMQVKGGRDVNTRYSRGGAFGGGRSAKSRPSEGRVCF